MTNVTVFPYTILVRCDQVRTFLEIASVHHRFNSLVCTYVEEHMSIWTTGSTYDSIPSWANASISRKCTERIRLNYELQTWETFLLNFDRRDS